MLFRAEIKAHDVETHLTFLLSFLFYRLAFRSLDSLLRDAREGLDWTVTILYCDIQPPLLSRSLYCSIASGAWLLSLCSSQLIRQSIVLLLLLIRLLLEIVQLHSQLLSFS